MKKISLALSLLMVINTAFAQAVSNVTKSTITFEIKNLGIKTGGNFSGLQANIRFDPANLAASKIDASIDAGTINTDNSMRDDHLKGEDYFNTAVYPKITMSSVAFKQKGGSNYTGQFNVTIKEKTNLVELPFTYTSTGNTAAILKGSFKINRRDFDVGGGSMTLGNDVTIFITAETGK